VRIRLQAGKLLFGYMQLQAPLPRGPGTRVWSKAVSPQARDHVDSGSAKWQLCHTDGLRDGCPVAETLNKEFRRPIRNSVRFREVRCAVDHDKGFTIFSNAAKIADAALSTANINCHVRAASYPDPVSLRPLSRRELYRPPCKRPEEIICRRTSERREAGTYPSTMAA